jgi:hypothetical protein
MPLVIAEIFAQLPSGLRHPVNNRKIPEGFYRGSG